MKQSFQRISLLGLLFLIVGCLNNKKENLQTISSNNVENNIETPEEVPGIFGEMLRSRRTAADETEPSYPPQNLWQEFKKTKQVATLRNATEFIWKERGPSNFSGRTRAFYRFSQNVQKETWLTGSVTGGIWKTYNGGKKWVNKTSDLPSLSISSIAASPSNEQIVYAGTGESFARFSELGMGILKSEDYGETWRLLESTVAMGAINRLVVDPENPDIVIVCNATEPSIYKTIDGGKSWKKVYQQGPPFYNIAQIIADPKDFNFLYASISSRGIIRSEDKGETWLPSDKGIGASGRIEIAVAPSNTNKLYALTTGDLSNLGTDLYFSEDKGKSWNILIENERTLTTADFLGGQGYYGNAVSVHPFDENTIYVGGVNLFEIKVNEIPDLIKQEKVFRNVGYFNTESFIERDIYSSDGNSAYRGNIEIRFGPDKRQKAHRFTVPFNSGTNRDEQAGVDFGDYLFEDIIDVPFEVWDVDNNMQLMVSIRDQNRNTVWDLQLPSNPQFVTREYIFIHDYPYNAADLPHAEISTTGGVNSNQMYFHWIINQDLSPIDIPNATVKFNTAIVTFKHGMSSKNLSPAALVEMDESPGLHVDFHNILNYPLEDENSLLSILTNDGGVYATKDFKNFDFVSKDYNTIQFYAADKAPGNELYIGGTQDNGTLMYTKWNNPTPLSRSFKRVIGGDGFDVVWNKRNSKLIFGGYQYGGFVRSVNGGVNWTYSPAIGTHREEFPFFNSIANSEKEPNTLYTISYSRIWKSNNFGESWNFIPVDEPFVRYPHIEISHANPQIVWAGSYFSETYSRLYLSTDEGNSFHKIAVPDGLPLGTISEIVTHPTDESTAYLLFSFSNKAKILKTEDLGQTWTDITGFENGLESSRGFPNIGVHHLLVFPDNPDQIWVGTDFGIVESKDAGASWQLLGAPFPHVMVTQLKYVDEQVVIATYGRGIWTADRKSTTAVAQNEEISEIYFYPNPVKTEAYITFELRNPQEVSFEVYDVSGRKVVTNNLGELGQGEHTHVWNPSNLADGTYFVRFKIGESEPIMKKIIYSASL